MLVSELLAQQRQGLAKEPLGFFMLAVRPMAGAESTQALGVHDVFFPK